MTVQPFISELMKAANQVDRLSEMEKARLLDRAGRTIQDMRDETGMGGEPSYDETDGAWYLRIIAKKTEQFSPDDIQKAMLDAVEMMRALSIMLDAKRELEGRPWQNGCG